MLSEIEKDPHILGNWLGYEFLNEDHSDIIKLAITSEKDICIQAHRGSYKTTAISTVGIIWLLLLNPNARILIASAGKDLARGIMKDIRRHYENPRLREIYKEIGIEEPIDYSNWRADSFSISTRKVYKKEDNIECVGVGGQVVGKHFDLVICDDLVTIKDRYSEVEREGKKRWVKDLSSILDPGGHVAYVGTPWHEDDIYSTVENVHKYPLGTIKVNGLTEEIIADIRKKQGESFFAAQYLLEHIPDSGRIFDSPTFGTMPEKLKKFAYLDPAFKEKGGDYNSFTIGGRMNGNIYIQQGEIWQALINDTYNKVEKMCKENDITTLIVESNAAQRVIAAEFRKRGINVVEMHNSENKHLRILNNAKYEWDNLIFDKTISKDYMKQVLDYTEFSAHDDAPDGLAGLIKYFKRNPEYRPKPMGSVGKSKVSNLPT